MQETRIPWSGRSPGEGNGNRLQYSCLGNPTGRGAWQATVHELARVGHDLATKSINHGCWGAKRWAMLGHVHCLLIACLDHHLHSRVWKSKNRSPWISCLSTCEVLVMTGGKGGRLEGEDGKSLLVGWGELLGAALQGAVVVVLVTLLLFASCRHESVSSFNFHFVPIAIQPLYH